MNSQRMEALNPNYLLSVGRALARHVGLKPDLQPLAI
jgi:hypothetical protein